VSKNGFAVFEEYGKLFSRTFELIFTTGGYCSLATKPRTLSAFIEISLDGYYCDLSDEIGFAHKAPDDAEWHTFVASNASTGNMLLLGRKTYDMMAAWWPTPMAAEAMPMVAAGMNEMPKIVCSRTLVSADWHNTSILEYDLIGTIQRMKDEVGPDITILGSGSIVAQLSDARLIDIYQVVVNPVALGDGKSIFSGLREPLDLELMNTRRFANGSTVLWYTPR
jgi:dihydrofolate reductase